MLTCQCSVDMGRRELRSFRFKLVPVDGYVENRKIKPIDRGNGKDKEIIIDEMQQCTKKNASRMYTFIGKVHELF